MFSWSPDNGDINNLTVTSLRAPTFSITNE